MVFISIANEEIEFSTLHLARYISFQYGAVAFIYNARPSVNVCKNLNNIICYV